MSTTYSFDVREDNFQQQVIEASHQQPVLVDFWATWCGPCKTLMPILTRLAEEYAGQFLLAKVEIDSAQSLAAQFGVRSVPTVKLVKNGQIVDEFTGALPEGQIRDFLDKHLEKASDQDMQQALAEYQQGQTEAALEKMAAILQADPNNHNNTLIYANVLLREGQLEAAEKWLAALPADMQDNTEVATLRAKIEFMHVTENAPDLETLEKAVAEDPGNCEARYQLSARYILSGQLEAAMDQLLEIVKRDRKFKDDIGRKGLLKVFELLGNNHPLATQYRRKLAVYLN